MNIIKNNPYRIIGLLVGATPREQERQIRRLKQFIEADQRTEDDFSFPSLGNLNRTIDNVNAATSKLNLDSDKMNNALFWFYKGNDITDEPAFDALKERNHKKSVEIWNKLIETRVVTQRNSSAFQNLSTLYLYHAFVGPTIEVTFLEHAISMKLKFLESDFLNDFKALATDITYKTTKKELQLSFLKHVQFEIDKNTSFASNKLFEILNKQEFSAKEDFLKGFVQKTIEQIENKIEEAKVKRKANKANAVNIGNTLYEQTAENLSELKSILETSNLKLSLIYDKVSDEILQCGIDYFLHYKDSSIDPGNPSMDLCRKAKTLAIGNIAKQRSQENTENLEEWIEDKPKRERQARILVDLEKLKNLIIEYEGRSKTVSNGKQLLTSAKPYLNNVKNALGSTDELYLGLSSRIASIAQGVCVSEINELQERFANTYDIATKMVSIILLKERVNEAWDVTATIGTMDLSQDFRARCTQNKNLLSNLRTQLSTVTQSATVNTGSKSSPSARSGCYIATMAYGDYNHPQVMILRQFRDNVLDKSAFGKWFIKTYYHYSPKLVEKLKNKKIINSIIRKTLNQFIKLIK